MTAADRPRVGDQIITAEQLDALPVGTVLRTRSGRLAETGYLATDTTPVVWCEGWGDYADAIEHYAPLTVLYVPGEPSRPSVTDNARADEQRSEYTVQETAAYFARKVQRVSDRIRSTDYQRSVSDIVGLDSIQGFLDRVARDDLDMFAAGRAETTTVTVEDAARAVAAWALDFAGLGVGIYLNGETIGDPNGPWDVPTDAADSLAAWLNQCGLLARPLPDRDQIARAMWDASPDADRPWSRAVAPERDWYLRDADAVLDLLRGGGGDR